MPAPLLDPLQVSEIFTGGVEIPDIMEFCLSDKYLDQPGIYPRQATLLKCIFLQTELFTDFDYEVIGQWSESFARTGNNGCQPDLLDRIRICQEQGRKWFREIIAVIGRRGSKGYTGAICSAYVLWHYMHRPGGPQAHYGIERSKKLVGIVFAGKKSQAKENQWRDLANVILGSACFAPYISRPLGEILTVFAPSDLLRAQKQALRGIQTDNDQATFELVPRESTLMAGRGPTSFLHLYDEMAHIVATGINRSAAEVYDAATPSLDQFGNDGFIYAGSSPWQMTGRYYELWQQSLEKNDDGTPAYPEKFMVQLTSWDPYKDWDRAEQILVRPPKKMVVYIHRDISATEVEQVPIETTKKEFFAHKKAPIQAYDAAMKQLERANPDNFEVERLSHWAAILDSYLDEKKVAAIFDPWQGEPLRIQPNGTLSVVYHAHGDPGAVNDRFGYALAHVETLESVRELADGRKVVDKVKHVIFDVLQAWDPADFPEHQVDYIQVGEEICNYIDAFMPAGQTFDQFASVEAIQRIRRHVAESRKPKRTDVYEVTATAKLNWLQAEIAKAAINLGRIHAPMLDMHGSVHDPSVLAELELRFLQRVGQKVDHPSSGPVQSKDVADAMFACIWQLIGRDMAEEIGLQLMGLTGTSMPGGSSPYSTMTGHSGARTDVADIAQQFRRASYGGATGLRPSSSPARGPRTR